MIESGWVGSEVRLLQDFLKNTLLLNVSKIKLFFSFFSLSPFSAFCSRWYFVFSSWDGSLWLSCSVTASLSLEFALSSNLSSCCGYAVLEFQSLFRSLQLEHGK